MAVPCCSGLVRMVQQATELSGKDIPIHEVNISIKGHIVSGEDQHLVEKMCNILIIYID